MNCVNLQTKIKSFREKDLEICKNLVNVDSWPEYYSDEFTDHENKRLPITIVSSAYGHPFQLTEISKINLSNSYSQEFRNGGENSEKPAIRMSLHEKGYYLDTHPIRLRLHKNGELSVGSGYTRLELLIELGFKNIICTVYRGDEDASDIEVNNAFNVFFFRDNANHRPAGMITKDDVAFNVKNSVIKGEIALDPDAIRYQVNAMTQPTSWTKKYKEEIAAIVFNACNNYTDENGNQVVVRSYTTEAVKDDFMMNYKDTATIKYMVFSTGSTKKIAYAVGEELKKHNKKIRIILHTDRLDAFDLESTYIKRINEANDEIKILWGRLSSFFGGAIVSDRVELYGCFPALSTLTPNMNEIVIFGVNDLFLKNSHYLTTKNKKALANSIDSFMLNDSKEAEELSYQ